MRHTNRSRAISYDVRACRWISYICAFVLALWLLWPAAAQQATVDPATVLDEVTRAEVDDSQVEKIQVDENTSIEILDIEGDAAAARVPETGTPAEPMDWTQRLVQTLERRLQEDPFINADQVKVTGSGGSVTLSGNVPSLEAKRRADDIARAMRGVQAIENNLTVRQADVPDATVRSYVQAALAQQPGITVTVNEGHVTLGGAVESWQEKQLAQQLVSSAHGVVSVTNDIEVTAGAELPTTTVAEQIRRRLRADPWIDADAIRVTVDDGAVKLSGSVQSLAQQERAFAGAWVRGVREVDISELAVAPFEARADRGVQEQQPHAIQPEQRPSATRAQQQFERAALDDQEIKDAVLLAFEYSPRLKRLRPEIEVDNGLVVLSGTADTVKTKMLAEEAVRNVRGVWRVENEIEIASETAMSDDQLADLVREKLDLHPRLSRLDVAVTVMGGAAYLSGNVASVSEQREAREVAASVPGIKTVHNSVNLAQETARLDDFQLMQQIQSMLYWSPYVDVDDVEISVTQGVVTLTGDVERWSSRLAAEDAAMQVGAIQVNNQLRVLEAPMEVARPQEQPLVRVEVQEDRL